MWLGVLTSPWGREKVQKLIYWPPSLISVCLTLGAFLADIFLPSPRGDNPFLGCLRLKSPLLAFQTISIFILGCKLDGVLRIGWRDISFIFWITIVLLAIIGILTMSMFFSVICPLFVCKKVPKKDAISVIWINLHILGILSFGIAFKIIVQKLLDISDDSNKTLSDEDFNPLWYLCLALMIYCIIMLTYTIVFFSEIE